MQTASNSISTPNATKKQTKNDILDRLDKLESFVKSLKKLGGEFPRLLREAEVD
jgi:hypothetical protein